MNLVFQDQLLELVCMLLFYEFSKNFLIFLYRTPSTTAGEKTVSVVYLASAVNYTENSLTFNYYGK